MRLRRPTKMYRATVSTLGRVIVPPELDAPPGAIRSVMLLVPADPGVHIGLDAKPLHSGMGRTHQWPLAVPGKNGPFLLLREQYITAMVEDQGGADAHITVVIEYCAE